MPPWPWGHLIYHEVLQKAFLSGPVQILLAKKFYSSHHLRLSRDSSEKPFASVGVPGQLAEFGVGLGGSSLFFGQLARLEDSLRDCF